MVKAAVIWSNWRASAIGLMKGGSCDEQGPLFAYVISTVVERSLDGARDDNGGARDDIIALGMTKWGEGIFRQAQYK